MFFKTTDLFRPVTFRPADALNQLKRSLRDLEPLAERDDGFVLQSQRVIELRSDANFITVRLASRHAHLPRWDIRVLKSSADVPKCVDEVKKRLVDWTSA
jgi:hypothetical protein